MRYISPVGWDYIYSLQQANQESHLGFCAMWFDESVKPLWTDGIEKAIKEAGYESKRVDEHPHNNRIDDEIIALIRRSRFVVADFTRNRGGVYFEAGYALGMGIPVIWTVRAEELCDIHFDNRQYNFLTWTSETIQREFKDKLRFRIEATIGRGPLR